MSDLFDWIQSYWYELASLTAQFAILAVLLWYARTTVKILAGSERPAEPMPEPSDASAAFAAAEAERQAEGNDGIGRRLVSMPEPSAYQTASATRRAAVGPNPWRAVVNWLNAPIRKQATRRVKAVASFASADGQMQHTEAATAFAPAQREMHPAGHAGVGRMLSPLPEPSGYHAQAAAYRRPKSSTPWRALVNWLRAPISNRGGSPWRRVYRQIS